MAMHLRQQKMLQSVVCIFKNMHSGWQGRFFTSNWNVHLVYMKETHNRLLTLPLCQRKGEEANYV